MKKRISVLIAVMVAVAACVLLASCGGQGDAPYKAHDESGYNVSVKYDANGGYFSTNTSIIVDSYNVSQTVISENGIASIKLTAPDDTSRVKPNYFTVSNPKYCFAGWYAKKVARTTIDSEGNVVELDINGNIAAVTGEPVAYDYGERWDFKNGRLEVDTTVSHSAEEPVITLYAAWIPEFTFKFCDLEGKVLGSYSFDPMYSKEIDVPVWDTKTGNLKLYKFPDVENKTFNNIYLDPAGKEKVSEGETKIKHTGTVNLSNATVEGSEMILYLDYLDGKWTKIHTAEQFLNCVTLSGNYNICADLDFAGLSWSSALMHGNFSGTINGNGYSFKNIEAKQTDANQLYAGVFGNLTAEAKIVDVSFENVSFTIGVGSRMNGASFGLLAGSINSNAVLENVSVGGKLTVTPSGLIDSNTTIGLLCGMGYNGNVDISAITAEALLPSDNYTDPIELNIDGNTVTVIVKE